MKLTTSDKKRIRVFARETAERCYDQLQEDFSNQDVVVDAPGIEEEGGGENDPFSLYMGCAEVMVAEEFAKAIQEVVTERLSS